MTYELAKELKDAGFPQHPYNAMCFCGAKTVDDPHHPTLSELIEACGEGFSRLLNHKKYGWVAYPTIEWTGEHATHVSYEKTPEEAVARLWLALNKK